MSYHFSKMVDLSFDTAIARMIDELKKEGFQAKPSPVKIAIESRIPIEEQLEKFFQLNASG